MNPSDNEQLLTSCEVLRPIIDNGQQSMLSAADLAMEGAAQDCGDQSPTKPASGSVNALGNESFARIW